MGDYCALAFSPLARFLALTISYRVWGILDYYELVFFKDARVATYSNTWYLSPTRKSSPPKLSTPTLRPTTFSCSPKCPFSLYTLLLFLTSENGAWLVDYCALAFSLVTPHPQLCCFRLTYFFLRSLTHQALLRSRVFPKVLYGSRGSRKNLPG